MSSKIDRSNLSNSTSRGVSNLILLFNHPNIKLKDLTHASTTNFLLEQDWFDKQLMQLKSPQQSLFSRHPWHKLYFWNALWNLSGWHVQATFPTYSAIFWALVVTLTQNHRIILLFNILEIFNALEKTGLFKWGKIIHSKKNYLICLDCLLSP